MKIILLKVNQFLLFWLLITIVLSYGSVILIPLTFAVMLAMLMAPVCRKLDAIGLHRTISTLVCIFILLIVFAVFISAFVLQVTGLIQDLPAIESRVNQLITQIHSEIESSYNVPVEEQKVILQNQVSNIRQSSATYFISILTSTTTLLANTVMILVITFLLLFNKEKYETFFLKLFKNKDDDKTKNVLNKITSVAQKYLTGRALSMLALFILYLIALLIIGIKNALLLSAIAALVNIIPYVGPLLAGVFPFLVAFVSYPTLQPAIWVVISFSVIQGIDNYFVTPMVMGGEVSLSALATILIIICGGFIWGIAGMILFVPMLSIAKIVFDQVDELKPFGYLIGKRGKSPTSKFKDWFNKTF